VVVVVDLAVVAVAAVDLVAAGGYRTVTRL
jgi:hypothetical protein